MSFVLRRCLALYDCFDDARGAAYHISWIEIELAHSEAVIRVRGRVYSFGAFRGRYVFRLERTGSGNASRSNQSGEVALKPKSSRTLLTNLVAMIAGQSIAIVFEIYDEDELVSSSRVSTVSLKIRESGELRAPGGCSTYPTLCSVAACTHLKICLMRDLS